GAEQGSAGPLGEALAADGAAEAADVPGLAGPAVRTDRVPALLPEGGTLGVGAAEGGPIARFHGTLLTGVPRPHQGSRSGVPAEGGRSHHPFSSCAMPPRSRRPRVDRSPDRRTSRSPSLSAEATVAGQARGGSG